MDTQDQSKAVAFSRACPGDGTADEEGAQAVASILTGLPTVDYEELKKIIPADCLPQGYEHFHALDAATGDQFNMRNRVDKEGRRVDLHDVLFGVLKSPFMEVTLWTATRKRPDTLPSFLDVDIDIVTVGRITMPSWRPWGRPGRPI